MIDYDKELNDAFHKAYPDAADVLANPDRHTTMYVAAYRTAEAAFRMGYHAGTKAQAEKDIELIRKLRH